MAILAVFGFLLWAAIAGVVGSLSLFEKPRSAATNVSANAAAAATPTPVATPQNTFSGFADLSLRSVFGGSDGHFHRVRCPLRADKNSAAMSIDEAEKKNLTACPKCRPAEDTYSSDFD